MDGAALALGGVCGLVWRPVWDWTAEMGCGLPEGRLRRKKREAVSGLPLMGWGDRAVSIGLGPWR